MRDRPGGGGGEGETNVCLLLFSLVGITPFMYYFDTLCSLYVCPKNKQRKTVNTTEHKEKR